MADECMLTTFDNPFDPFEQFTSWYMFDVEKGYNTCSRLARVTHLSSEFTQKETDEEVERAMNEIIKYDFMNVYKKVSKTKNDNAQINNNNQINK